MKKIILLLLSLTVGFAHAASKEREGTKVELSAAEVADLKFWVDNARTSLQYLSDQVKYLSLEEKRSAIKREFERIVGQSARKENELYVRYVLNRALDIDEKILFNSQVNPNPTSLELEMTVALFMKSIQMVLTLYTDDKAYLEAVGQGAAPKQEKHMAVFGLEYAELLINDAKTLLNPTLEYLVTRTALGYLANDLNSSRNLDRALFANEVVRLQQLLSVFGPYPPFEDQKIIQSIRRFKFEYRERVRTKLLENLSSLKLNFNIKNPNMVNSKNGGFLKRSTQKSLSVGEKVRWGHSLAEIVGIYPDGQYAIKYVFYGSWILHSERFARKDFAVTSGCHVDLCVGEEVRWRGAVAEIIGIYPDGQYAIKYVFHGSWIFLIDPFPREQFAKTK